VPDLEALEFAVNPDPRCPCVLLLDTSSSMAGAPIRALNEGLQTFQNDLHADELANRRVEIALVSFGSGGVQVRHNFVTADQFVPPMLEEGGNTPMGEGIVCALGLVRERKGVYRQNGIQYYRPWVFMVTDGAPTDDVTAATQQLRSEEDAKGVAFFAVGVANADMGRLAQISTRAPLKLQGLQFTELFQWLSSSQKRVSASRPGEVVPIAPPGWAEV
jgi:uncharacterized protein YegL